MIKLFFHKVYELLGVLLCRIYLVFWNIRDKILPPNSDSLLIVAHPDDDALFFHSFIKKNKPYVALMTTGWSIRRLHQYFKVMKYYGCKFRAYPINSAELWDDESKYLPILDRQVKECLNLSDFKTCITHGEAGEYGHAVHKRIHRAVISNAKCKVLTTVPSNKVINYPLDKLTLDEKKNVFQTKYTSEAWCIIQYALWMEHEHLEEIER